MRFVLDKTATIKVSKDLRGVKREELMCKMHLFPSQHANNSSKIFNFFPDKLDGKMKLRGKKHDWNKKNKKYL